MITEYKEKYWHKIEEEIKRVSKTSSLPEVALLMIDYQLKSGGKRVRPILSVITMESFEKFPEDAYSFAAGVELIHNASLVHDDIQDKDSTRRGKPTVWKAFSIEQAINLGDLLFILSFELFDSLKLEPEKRLEIIRNATASVADLVKGQMLEFYAKATENYTEDYYFKIVKGKTASLFSFTFFGTGLILNLSKHQLDQLFSLGEKIGFLFQIRDDLIDLIGKKEGRLPGGDIKEGKITLPVAYFFKDSQSFHERKFVLSVLKKEREKTTNEEVSKVIELLKVSGSINKTLKKFQEIEESLFDLDVLKDNPYFHSKISLFLKELKTGLNF